MSLIDRGRVMIDYLKNVGRKDSYKSKFEALCKAVDESPAVEYTFVSEDAITTRKETVSLIEPVKVIPIYVIQDYLQKVIDEWNELGDRKYELPNMQVYNHVRKCQDDLERWIESNG